MKIKPYDLIFFRGSEIVSKTITNLERSVLNIPVEVMVWSHVGIVVDRSVLDLPCLKPGELYVMESTWSYAYGGDGIEPVDGHRFGVQIRPLNKLLNYYTGNPRVYIGYAESIHTYNQDCTDIYLRKYQNKRYDFHPISLSASIFPKLRFLRFVKRRLHLTHWSKAASFYFCSELVADLLRELKIIGRDVNPRDVLPMDLVNWDKDNFPRLYKDPIALKAVHLKVDRLKFADRA